MSLARLINTARGKPAQSGGMVASHRHNNFDIMRLIFASIVLLSHSFELLDGDRHREPLTYLFHTISFGELGVDCFFILSGFLITASWERNPEVVSFLVKRVLRIYPGYLVAFFVSVYVVGTLGAADRSVYLQGLHLFALFREAVMLQPPATPATFPGWPYAVVNGAMWTINYEFLCYLLVLVLGVSSLLGRRRMPLLLWGGTLVVFALFRASRWDDPQTGAINGGHIVTIMRFLPMFFSGALLYSSKLYQYQPPKWLVLSAALLLIAGLSWKVSAELAVASAGAYLLVWVGHKDIGLVRLRRLPDISYGVYLYGWPLQKLVIASALLHSPIVVFASSWTLALLAGFASWHLVEKPSLHVKRLTLVIAASTDGEARLMNARGSR